MLKRKPNLGFSLVELLLALLLSTVIFTGLMTIFLANMRYYQQAIADNRLHLQLQSALDIMANDIRRAGYSSSAQNDIGLNQNNNPFVAPGNDLQINSNGQCLLFTYDQTGSATLPALSGSNPDNRFGYRLSNQVLQARPPGAPFDCTALPSAWENISDQHFMLITQLNFQITTHNLNTGPGTKSIALRAIDISITGQLTQDPSISKTLTQHIKVRNDKFIP